MLKRSSGDKNLPISQPKSTHPKSKIQMSNSQRLSDTQIQELVGNLPGWSLEGQQLKQVRTFKDFVEAIKFVNQLVEPAEAAGHHPDLMISYNRVTICLTTHDAGGLTEKDFALAQTISAII